MRKNHTLKASQKGSFVRHSIVSIKDVFETDNSLYVCCLAASRRGIDDKRQAELCVRYMLVLSASNTEDHLRLSDSPHSAS